MASDPRSLACPKCATPWADAPSVACPHCDFPVATEVFPSAHRTAVKPSDPALPAAPGEATCFLHTQRRAAVACDQCGRMVCGLCDVPVGRRHLCPPCFDGAQTRADGDLPATRTLHGRVALTLSIIPLFPPTAIAALVVVIVSRKKPDSLVRPNPWPARVAVVLATLQLIGAALVASMAWASS